MKRTSIVEAMWGCVLCLTFAAGCSSSPESQTSPPPSPQRPAGQQAPPQMEFETRTDTIRTLKSKPGEPARADTLETQIRYMVQIGAFRNPHNAAKVQVSARDRYHMPVVNDYDTVHGLYQIRIGFFESEEAAQAFCDRLRREYPVDYKGSWVIQLTR